MDDRHYQYLDKINSPADLKQVPKEDLGVVAAELRSFIIDEVAKHPGHLGSSLGVVELTVALHYVFDTPYDRIIWDVGHQAYGHKILTGRRDVFHTNRQLGGISGFPTPRESEYDAFGTGHASTSISAGLGMSVAALLKKDERRKVVAVIGDGAMTGGLAFEGLNNTSMDKNNLLIILNDNQMAIDPIKGGFNQYLVDITTSPTYNKIRHRLYTVLHRFGLMDDERRKRIIRLNNSIKARVSSGQPNIFEGLNIRYFGPVDGHDVQTLVRVLSEIKNYKGPKVLHVITKKGKGYKPAEDDAPIWHAPGVFDVKTGQRACTAPHSPEPPLFQDVFGETLLELARTNPRIVGITPAMPSAAPCASCSGRCPNGCSTWASPKGTPSRSPPGWPRRGCCRSATSTPHSCSGPTTTSYTTWPCSLHVVLCIDRAGIVGADGATHQGEFDLAYLRPIPHLAIAAPRNEMELRNLMYTAQCTDTGPFAIRYPRGKGFNLDWRTPLEQLPVGKGEQLKEGDTLAVLTIGTMAHPAARAIAAIEAERPVNIAHYDMRYLKPLDEELLHQVAQHYNKVVTVEDGVIAGGFGSAVLEFMADHGYAVQVTRLGIPDTFVEHGSQAELYHLLGLDAEGIQHSIEAVIND